MTYKVFLALLFSTSVAMADAPIRIDQLSVDELASMTVNLPTKQVVCINNSINKMKEIGKSESTWIIKNSDEMDVLVAIAGDDFQIHCYNAKTQMFEVEKVYKPVFPEPIPYS